MQPCASMRSDSEWRAGCLRRPRSSQISSDEPPPMSNTSAKSQPKSISEAQPETASSGLRLAADDGDVEPGLRACPREELVGVGGEPAGLGGDQAGACHLVAPDLGRTYFQRFERALDGGLRQPAARRHALAEADDAREGVDHLEAAPRRPRHQQPAVVGAEIERGIGGPGSRARRWRSRGGRAAAGRRVAGRSVGDASRAGVGRAWPVTHLATGLDDAQHSAAVLVLRTLHVRLRRPVCNPAGSSGVILVELGGTLSARSRG